MYKLFCAILFVGISCSYNAQELKSTNSQVVQKINPEAIEKLKNRLKSIDYHLYSIQTKSDFILSDEEEKKIAEEEGWFEKMEAVKQNLLEEKQRIETKLNSISN